MASLTLRYSRERGHNPGLGLLTTNAFGGQEIVGRFHLTAPAQYSGPNKNMEISEAFLLCDVHTSDKITKIVAINCSNSTATLSFFFGYYDDNGDVHIFQNKDKNSFVTDSIGPCPLVDGSVNTNFANLSDKTFLLATNSGSLARSKIGDDYAGNDLVASQMGLTNTKLAVFVKSSAQISPDQLNAIQIVISVVPQGLSVRNEDEPYVKSWDSLPANNAGLPKDGVIGQANTDA